MEANDLNPRAQEYYLEANENDKITNKLNTHGSCRQRPTDHDVIFALCPMVLYTTSTRFLLFEFDKHAETRYEILDRLLVNTYKF